METIIMGLYTRVKGGKFGVEGLQSKKLCSKEAPKYPSLTINRRPFPQKRCSPDQIVLLYHQE